MNAKEVLFDYIRMLFSFLDTFRMASDLHISILRLHKPCMLVQLDLKMLA